MSTQDSTSPGKGIGLFPKLILWTLVIVFGALYLSSAKRHADESAEASPGGAETIAAGPSVAAQAGATAAPDEGAGSVSEPVSAPVSESGTAPVQAAESAAFARTLMDNQSAGQSPQPPEGERSAASDAAPRGVQGVHRLETGAPAQDSNVARAVGAVPAVPAAVSLQAVTPAGPQVGAERGSPVAPAAAFMPPGAMPAAPVLAPGPAAVPVAPVPRMQSPAAGHAASVAPAATAERDRILAEYEAMQRAAEEQMRQQWQRMAVPAPYGYPGYVPAPYPAR